MTERPILFSASLVRAILAGRKTQTRRLVKPQPRNEGFEQNCPYGAPGDRMWVREAWSPWADEWTRREARTEAPCLYRADYIDGAPCSELGGTTWRPSIFMPRALSRITLEITETRVDRLQDITEFDARAEGVAPMRWSNKQFGDEVFLEYLPAFAGEWDKLIGDRAPWSSNPFVWVISFKRVGEE